METETLAVTPAKAEEKTSRARAGKPQRGIFEKVPGSGIWWIRYVDAQGRYRREKAGTWGNAGKLLTKRKNEALQGKKLPETLRQRVVLFGEIAEDALGYSRGHKRSYQDDESRMKRLVEWFGNREAESLTGQELEKRLSDVAAAEKWAASTYNHYRSLLMLVYREARHAEKVTVNPARDIRHRREDNSRVRYLNQFEPAETEVDYLKPLKTEEERLRAVISREFPKHLAEFQLAVNTGMRKGSQYGLTWDMVDWNGRMLNIPRTKNEEPLHLPLNNAARAALKSIHRGERVGCVFRSERTGDPLVNSRHWFDDAVKTAGIRDFHWHDLRHTFASRLRMKGARLADIAELLGHKGLTMTKRYAHLGPNQLHEVAALLDSNSTTVAPETKSETAVSKSFVN